MPYLDTSVLTSYYCPEARTARVQQVLPSLVDPVISPLVGVELHCVVARRVRAGALAEVEGRTIFTEFRRHLAEGRLRVIPIEVEAYRLAQDWLAQLATPLRVLDGLHLATAFTHHLPLITADRQLAAVAPHFGVQCDLLD